MPVVEHGKKKPSVTLKRVVARAAARFGLLPWLSDAYLFLKSNGMRSQRSLAYSPALPPPSLRFSSAGTSDPEWFVQSGRQAYQCLTAAVGRHLVRTAPRAVLDFGCGCGRVLRHASQDSGTRHVGVDWNRRAIRCCRKLLPFADFFHGSLLPPLHEDLGRFDLIYAFSVFTHLPLEAQKAWAREFAAHLEIGGLLILSTHGDAFAEDLSESESTLYRGGKVVIREPIAAGTNVCAAFHPGDSLLQVMPAGLRKVEFIQQGALGNPPQDLWVLVRDR